MGRLRSWRGSSCALVVLWVLALFAPHVWRSAGARLVPVGHRAAGTAARPRAARGMAMLRGAQPAAGAHVLGQARATRFAAGTNMKGDAAGAAWTFLLPSLELGLVVVAGRPSRATLRTLSRLAREVVVACPDARDRARVRRCIASVGAANVQAVGRAEAIARLPRADAAFVDPDGSRLLRRRPRRLDLGAACKLRVGPASGEVRIACAEGDAAALAYLEVGGGGSRPARLAFPGATESRLAAPAYVGKIAQAAGIDLDGYRAGLVAPSEYTSRKAVLFLFRADEPRPELVVKLTREPTHNGRLENEWRALRRLDGADLPGSGVLPRPLFFGHHGGLALLGESAVHGEPLRRCTTARADCRLAGEALRWLLEFGAATAHPASHSGDVAAALGDLLDRFEGLYRLGGAERDRLHRHVDALAEASEALPLVFQHGDPGTWNVIVARGGRPGFLDWEAAEPEGMPLWDVFYFLRSFAVTVARANGVRRSLPAVRRELVEDGAVGRLLVAAVERQCAQIGLARELVEPLFTTCWMHRALKEATRLLPRALERGHYVNLLRLSLERPDAPGLGQLFGPQ